MQLTEYVVHSKMAVLVKLTLVDLIGHRLATPKTRARKNALNLVMIVLDALITCGLMTKDAELKQAAAKQFLLQTLLSAKKVV